MSEVENFEGKPNLTEIDFCALGQRFKFSNWFDTTTFEGVSKIEQDGVLLARDDRMSHDIRKPFFDLEIYVDQQKHRLQIFVFGFLSWIFTTVKHDWTFINPAFFYCLIKRFSKMVKYPTNSRLG